jgi:hypothetical protein
MTSRLPSPGLLPFTLLSDSQQLSRHLALLTASRFDSKHFIVCGQKWLKSRFSFAKFTRSHRSPGTLKLIVHYTQYHIGDLVRKRSFALRSALRPGTECRNSGRPLRRCRERAHSLVFGGLRFPRSLPECAGNSSGGIHSTVPNRV